MTHLRSCVFSAKICGKLFTPLSPRHLASEHFHCLPVLEGEVARPSVFSTKNDVAYFFSFECNLPQQFSGGGENSDGAFAMPANVQISITVAFHSVHAKIIEFMK